jgi:hypothetical protein
MPTAWDPANLLPNLQALAGLSTAAAGSKLSYNNATGRFSIQGPGFFRQTLARTFSSDSVESEEHFARPVKGVFQAARQQIGAAVSQVQFNNALAGLKALRAAYSGQPEKLGKLDAVIADIENPLVGESDDFVSFRKRYKRYLIYSVSMGPVLRRSDVGICQAFVIDWARRILGGKASYAVSKKRHEEYGPDTSLPADEQARMARKVDTRLRSFQQHLDKKGSMDYRDMKRAVTSFGRPGRPEDDRPYGDLILGRLAWDDFREDDEPMGREVLSAAVKACNRYSKNLAMLSLLGKIKEVAPDRFTAEGHAIGLDLSGHGVHIFDPNMGEFIFPPGSDALGDFCDDLWRRLYANEYRGYQVLSIGW